MKTCTLRTLTAVALVLALLAGLSTAVYAESYDHFTPLPEDSGVITFGSPSSGSNSTGSTPSSGSSTSTTGDSGSGAAASDYTYTLEEFAALHLAEVNKIRAEYGVPELLTDPVLTEMAMQRAAEYSPGHKRADGSDWYTIFDDFSTGLEPTGENMSAAGGSPESSARGFLTSAGHSANLLNPDAEYIGVGVVWVDTVVGPRIAVIELFAK